MRLIESYRTLIRFGCAVLIGTLALPALAQTQQGNWLLAADRGGYYEKLKQRAIVSGEPAVTDFYSLTILEPRL
jgi:hypothetical protein